MDVEEIRTVEFPMGFRGYDSSQVDAVLDEVLTTLEHGGRVDPAWLATVSFRTTLRGYARPAVDAFMQWLRATS